MTGDQRTGGYEAFVLSELAIDTPLEELRRVLGRKLRALEAEPGNLDLEAHRRAFRLAEEHILRRMPPSVPPSGAAPQSSGKVEP